MVHSLTMSMICNRIYKKTLEHITSFQGHIQKFFEGVGGLNFFVWTGKFRGGVGIFFLKTSKLKKFPKNGGVLTPKTPT